MSWRRTSRQRSRGESEHQSHAERDEQNEDCYPDHDQGTSRWPDAGLEIERLGRVRLDLLSQAPDMNRHGSRVESSFVAPDTAHQLVSREDAPRIAGKEAQKIELLRGQRSSGPALRTSLVAVSISMSPKVKRTDPASVGVERRSTVRTRAASSRGENGFVT